MVSDIKIQKILADKTNLHDKEITLMAAAKSAGGMDNITFQLIEISDSPHKKSVFESKNFQKKQVKRKNSLLKYALLVLASVIILLTGIMIGRKTNQPHEAPIIPADSTIIINKQDTIILEDTINQESQINHNINSL